MNDLLIVQTTAATREDANHLARTAVEERMAACAQVSGPIQSTFWWRGRIESGEEWLCFLKTDLAHFAALEALLKSRHPYEVPEIIATPIANASAAYAQWLKNELAPFEPPVPE